MFKVVRHLPLYFSKVFFTYYGRLAAAKGRKDSSLKILRENIRGLIKNQQSINNWFLNQLWYILQFQRQKRVYKLF